MLRIRTCSSNELQLKLIELADPVTKNSQIFSDTSSMSKESKKTKRRSILSSDEGDMIKTILSAPNSTYSNKLRLSQTLGGGGGTRFLWQDANN